MKQLPSRGLIAPIYTPLVGMATIRERIIPDMAAYAFPFWLPAPIPSFYLFKDIRKNPE
jgi:hypothetical protein